MTATPHAPRTSSRRADAGRMRSGLALLALAVLALLVTGIAAVAVWDIATITAVLPPGPDTADPNVHEYVNTPALIGLIPVGLAAALGLGGLVVGTLSLARRRGRWWQLTLPGAAIILALLGPVAAASVATPTF